MMKLLLGLLFVSHALAQQVPLSRVEKMATIPQPFGIIDFRQLALDFDRKVFDLEARGPYWPMVWMDHNRSNFDQPVLGLYTAVGDIRQGPQTNAGAFHESLGTMGAVLGATLVGIDKSKQDFNYVRMLKNYFNRETGWNIMMNNTTPAAGANGGGYGRDWWYDVYPNLLFYAIYDLYPQEADFDWMARSIAEKFYQADQSLKGNYNWSYYDYALMEPKKSWICEQPDVAAGHAWVMYAAYRKFGDAKYLAGAKSALNALVSNTTNPSYEVLMPFGALMAARLNAEEGASYDVEKLLDWTFDGTAICREGWGTLVGRWNGYDISGIVGSTVDHGGFGFMMNTYDQAWPLTAMVRYDQRFATAIGKWMLNAANASKFFYPENLPAIHQTIPELAAVTRGVIGYEGLIRRTTHPEYETTTRAPVAQGDGPKWIAGNPAVSQFSVYGSAHVGIFGALIAGTDVPEILRLDLLATDFFRGKAYPSWLYYNPHGEARTVSFTPATSAATSLYDLVSGQFVARALTGESKIVVPAQGSVVIVEVPATGVLQRRGTKLLVNGVVVDFRATSQK